MFSPFKIKRSKNPKNQRAKYAIDLRDIKNVKMYSYKELRIATGNFSSENRLGAGAFGIVYKGKLRDGTTVAIKALQASVSNYQRQVVEEMFKAEITVLSCMKHENIVKLYGYCVEGTFRFLVYEYYENGSLAETLFGSGRNNVQLNWKTRSKIAIGVARGLTCLHEDVQPHIVHRDIKPDNVLLDESFSPKIADFGLAKFHLGNTTDVSNQVAGTVIVPANTNHSGTSLAGTKGYIAPELFVHGKISRRLDVYSFGILLLEIVSGRRGLDSRLPDREANLVNMAWELYGCGELAEIIDASLNKDLDVEEACRFLKVGFLCAQYSAERRPSMSTVVRLLISKRDIDEEDICDPRLPPPIFSSSNYDASKSTLPICLRRFPLSSCDAASGSGSSPQLQFRSFQADRNRGKHQQAKTRCLSFSFRSSETRTESWTSSFILNPRICFSPPCEGGFDSDESFA